jgi:hypothetical protein
MDPYPLIFYDYMARNCGSWSCQTHQIFTPPLKYQVSFPLYCQSITCPMEGCTGKASTREHLRCHFMYKHLEDDIVIMEEGALPRCWDCGMFTSYSSLAYPHKKSWQCKRGKELKYKRSITSEAHRALRVVFNINGTPIESVNTFKYLGRQTSS